MLEFVKKYAKPALIFLFVAVVGLGLWMKRDSLPSLPFSTQQKPPPPPLAKDAPKAPAASPVTGAANIASSAAAPLAALPAPSSRAGRKSQFTFGDFTDLRGEIIQGKMRLEKREIERKTPKEGEKETSPPPAPRQEPTLPSLPQASAPAPRPTRAPAMPEAVVGVEGVDGNLSAVIRTSAGRQVTVKPGDKYGGGVVSDISRSGVVVRRGKTASTIHFE